MQKLELHGKQEKAKIVLDTNVIISGLISTNGYPAIVLNFISGNPELFDILLTDEILAEYDMALKRPRFGFKIAAVESVLEFFLDEGILLTISKPGAEAILKLYSSIDQGDDKFIVCAVEGKADFLITGNIRHFKSLQLTKTKVISPKDFFTQISPGFLP